jgi:uncharacterized protein YdiU (UPF0061 family)
MNSTAQTLMQNPIAAQHYRTLPPGMFASAEPTPASKPAMIALNRGLLAALEIDASWFESAEALTILSGSVSNAMNPPIAMAYSGHQFGHWVPLLGDGRAHMLGQIESGNGTAIDVQLKGSGRTQYSRGGDGRATLGSVIREYIVSEAMAGLGIPTTRSLAVIGTGNAVMRERALPGAILVRTAASHMRVGSFQHAAANLDAAAVRVLADHVIASNYPDLAAGAAPYAELLGAIVERQAGLIAQWMLVGFIHGVMNTDNMSVVGETIDFGPCAFMDEFHPQKVFSSIDAQGRYAWDQQAPIALWNLTQLAASLLPVLDDNEEHAVAIAKERLGEFTPKFNAAFAAGLCAKFGFRRTNSETEGFAKRGLLLLAQETTDFTVFFDRLTAVVRGEPEDNMRELFGRSEKIDEWLSQWRTHELMDKHDSAAMRSANPALIARNHRVEQAIAAATDSGDFAPFRRLCSALSNPFEVAPADVDLMEPPHAGERVTQTFCGT